MGKVEILRVEPGDVIVMTFFDWLSTKERKAWKDGLGELFPENAVLILDGRRKISILRPAEKSAESSETEGIPQDFGLDDLETEIEEKLLEMPEGLKKFYAKKDGGPKTF